MKLFGGNSRSKTPELIRNLEKIAKIAVLRIDKEDTQTIIDDLKWIEDNFISLLKLREKDFRAFKALIDPENRYKKVAFESIDWSKVDFSKVKVVRVHDNITEEDKRYRKSYNSPLPHDKNDLLGKYIEVIFIIWNKSTEKKNFAVQRVALYVIANWIGVLDRQNDDNIDFQIIVKFFLRNLTNLNWSILQAKDEDLNPLFRFLSYNIYLDKIFDEDLNRPNASIYFDFLFENIFFALKAEREEVVNEFVERCVNSTFFPETSLGKYSELHSLLDEAFGGIGQSYEVRSGRLKRISEFGLYNLRYLRNDDEYQSWEKEFDSYLGELSALVEFTDEIRTKVIEIKTVAFRVLNFNRLQITILKVFAYAIFKGLKNPINHAFEFNQPGDSNASWGNREILPDSLSEILNYLTFSFSMESELLRYWEGHHGIRTYIDGLFLILFYRYKPQRKYYVEDIPQVVKDFCKTRLRNDSSSITSLKEEIEHLREKLENVWKNKTDFQKAYFTNEEKVNKTIQRLGQIAQVCEAQLQEIQSTSEIKSKTKERFLSECVAYYEKLNFLHRLFKKYEKNNPAPDLSGAPINPGVNELFDRMAFIENWHVPYIGLIETTGTTIAENENSIGLGAIRAVLSSEPSGKITESDIPKIIRNASFANKIVIGSNLYFESILEGEADFKPVWKNKEQDMIPNFYVGSLGDTLVFNVYDRIFTNKTMMILSSDFLLNVVDQPILDGYKQYGNFACKFIDFAYDEDETKKFLDNPPQWMQDQIKDRTGQEKFIKRKVWIQILKGVQFNVLAVKDGLYYNVE